VRRHPGSFRRARGSTTSCITATRTPGATGSFTGLFPGLDVRYRGKWYVLHGHGPTPAAPLLFGLGIHGQNLFIDPEHQVVVAKVSSQALPARCRAHHPDPAGP